VTTDESKGSPGRLNTKGEAAAGIPIDELFGHFCAHSVNESASGAVHRDHQIRRHRLQLCDRVLDVVGWRYAEMEPAQHCMQFIDAGYRYGLPNGIYDAAMAAG